MKIQDPNKVWFTSDLHFGHRFMAAYRGFGNTPFEEFMERRDQGATSRELVPDTALTIMHATMARIINDTVPVGDTLFILGDFSMHAKAVEVAAYRNLLACENIHLIKGNHDDHKSVQDAGFASVRTRRTVSYKVDGVRTNIVCDHFPIELWENASKGWIHLHGHLHGDGREHNMKRFDVGVDSLDFGPSSRPVSFAEVMAAAESRTDCPDHHSTPGIS